MYFTGYSSIRPNNHIDIAPDQNPELFPFSMIFFCFFLIQLKPLLFAVSGHGHRDYPSFATPKDELPEFLLFPCPEESALQKEGEVDLLDYLPLLSGKF